MKEVEDLMWIDRLVVTPLHQLRWVLLKVADHFVKEIYFDFLALALVE